MRKDEPIAVNVHANRFPQGKVLCVLGGPSAANWQRIRDEIQPDCVIGANGANLDINNLEYWLCTENMAYPNGRALKGEQRYIDIMKAFNTLGARVRMVNYKSTRFLEDTENVIPVQREGENDAEVYSDPQTFNWREYGEGFLNGPVFGREECTRPSVRIRVGTVALQLMHLAGILGAAEIHTTGFDLCLGNRHHWYNYPEYKPTRFYTEQMFTEYKGRMTLWLWVDTLDYLRQLLPGMERQGIRWCDHSEGLIQAEGLLE